MLELLPNCAEENAVDGVSTAGGDRDEKGIQVEELALESRSLPRGHLLDVIAGNLMVPSSLVVFGSIG
jgi:hypothetical protein